MGKRKSSSKPQAPKKADPLPSTFTCLFCNHEKTVTVKLNKKSGVGQLDCRICGQNFQCPINYLSAAVDVYAEWVDAADIVAEGDPRAEKPGTEAAAGGKRGSTSRQARDNANAQADDYEDEEDDEY